MALKEVLCRSQSELRQARSPKNANQLPGSLSTKAAVGSDKRRTESNLEQSKSQQVEPLSSFRPFVVSCVSRTLRCVFVFSSTVRVCLRSALFPELSELLGTCFRLLWRPVLAKPKLPPFCGPGNGVARQCRNVGLQGFFAWGYESGFKLCEADIAEKRWLQRFLWFFRIGQNEDIVACSALGRV